MSRSSASQLPPLPDWESSDSAADIQVANSLSQLASSSNANEHPASDRPGEKKRPRRGRMTVVSQSGPRYICNRCKVRKLSCLPGPGAFTCLYCMEQKIRCVTHVDNGIAPAREGDTLNDPIAGNGNPATPTPRAASNPSTVPSFIPSTTPVALSEQYRNNVKERLQQLLTDLDQLQGSSIEIWNTALLRENLRQIINTEIAVVDNLHDHCKDMDMITAMRDFRQLEKIRNDTLIPSASQITSDRTYTSITDDTDG